MNRFMAISVFALSLLTLALLPSSAVSQQKSLKEQLVGTWIQVSIEGTFPDGTKRQLFGPNPKGIVIFTSDGYFSLMQSRADLTKLASSNRATATPEEAKATGARDIAICR